MPVVRQLPELYLRGSLANITMANLTQEQKERAEIITEYVANHPDMAQRKNKFIKKLRSTIGADYNDRSVAEHEFQIAIWRATIDLCFHGKYTFTCQACNQSTYLTRRGRPKTIDRIVKPCPNCNKVLITKSGATNLEIGQHISMAEFQDSYRNLTDADDQPLCESTIVSVKISNKYENPDDIINDPKQLSKFYGEFVQNYCFQILKENSRFEHRKDPREIVGPADQIIIEELLALCTKYKISYSYDKDNPLINGYVLIQFPTLKTPPEFSLQYAALSNKAKSNNIDIIIADYGIKIKLVDNAPIISTLIVKPEHVLVLDNKSSSYEDEDFTINQIGYRQLGEEHMDLEDHVAVVESTDYLARVRELLPDGPCRSIFDIYSNQGEVYDSFCNHGYTQIGTKPPINHIAKFLDITPRVVKTHISRIKFALLASKCRFSKNIQRKY